MLSLGEIKQAYHVWCRLTSLLSHVLWDMMPIDSQAVSGQAFHIY